MSPDRHTRAVVIEQQPTWREKGGGGSTERLAEDGIEHSVGSVGDSYDNTLAETVIGLYKTEVIRQRGPWKHLDDVEYANPEWVDWFNTTRPFRPIGDLHPPNTKPTTTDKTAQPKRPDSSQRVSVRPGRVHPGHLPVMRWQRRPGSGYGPDHQLGSWRTCTRNGNRSRAPSSSRTL